MVCSPSLALQLPVLSRMDIARPEFKQQKRRRGIQGGLLQNRQTDAARELALLVCSNRPGQEPGLFLTRRRNAGITWNDGVTGNEESERNLI
jgi:hypothetical protein